MKKFYHLAITILLMNLAFILAAFTRAYSDEFSSDKDMREHYSEAMEDTDYIIFKAKVLEIEYDDTNEKRNVSLEGLVTIIPNKGAYVTGISDKDVNDIFMIRSYLEGLCAAWACENITEEQLEEMEESVFLAEFHAEKEHFEQVVELDNKFHKILYHACGSRVLSKLLVDYHHYAQKVRKVNLSEEKRAKHSILEHKRIVEAIRNKNVKAAEEYAHDHIMESIKRMHDAEADVK